MSPTAPRKTRPATNKAASGKAGKPIKSVAKGARTAKSTAMRKAPAEKNTSSKPAKVARKGVSKLAASKKEIPSNAALKKVATKQAATQKITAKKATAEKSSPGKTAKPAPVVSTATSKTIARKSATSGGKVARKSPGVNRRLEPVTQPARVAPVQTAAKPKTFAREAAQKRAVSPAIAKRHFLEVLEAKQERVRQGPSYPAANAFTGRPDAHYEGAQPSGEEEVAPVVGNAPSADATYGAGLVHARGNQGMRKQR